VIIRRRETKTKVDVQMECQREKLRGISKVLHITLWIVFAVSIVLGSMQIVAYLWTVLGLPGETFLVNGEFVMLPAFLQIGGINLFYRSLFEMGGLGWQASLRTFLALVTLFMAERMFRQLRNGASPFSEAVIRWFKRFAIAFVLLQMGTNVITVTFALIFFAISYVFDYGRLLQDESDTTL